MGLTAVGVDRVARVSSADVEMLEPQFAPFDRHDLINLSNWSACVKIQVSGQVVTPSSLRTQAPDTAPDAAVKASSGSRYTRPRAEVEAEIEDSLQGLRDEEGTCSRAAWA